jgi:hypothetical protein
VCLVRHWPLLPLRLDRCHQVSSLRVGVWLCVCAWFWGSEWAWVLVWGRDLNTGVWALHGESKLRRCANLPCMLLPSSGALVFPVRRGSSTASRVGGTRCFDARNARSESLWLWAAAVMESSALARPTPM